MRVQVPPHPYLLNFKDAFKILFQNHSLIAQVVLPEQSTQSLKNWLMLLNSYQAIYTNSCSIYIILNLKYNLLPKKKISDTDATYISFKQCTMNLS